MYLMTAAQICLRGKGRSATLLHFGTAGGKGAAGKTVFNRGHSPGNVGEGQVSVFFSGDCRYKPLRVRMCGI